MVWVLPRIQQKHSLIWELLSKILIYEEEGAGRAVFATLPLFQLLQLSHSSYTLLNNGQLDPKLENMSRNYVLIGILLILLGSCDLSENPAKITDKNDYDKYLVANHGKATSKYFEIWNSKIRPDSSQLMSFGIVGGEYERFFKNTGDIQYLKKAEAVLRKAADIAAIGKAGIYRALARNYISQHRFKEALQIADSARACKSGVEASQSLLFDVHMELGNYNMAKKYLDSLKHMSNFGYLIRLSKWNDHLGDLGTAIHFMEKATKKAKSSNNEALQLWAYTNLADFYGHAGRIEDSYSYYLKALEIDSDNAYAKKGIAWIVFSHEKKPEEAMRILDSVTKTYSAPDYFLLKAEIAGYLNDDLKRLINLDQYFKLVSNPAYGNMYNRYNISIYVDETGQLNKAFDLAQKEVELRPTPESYGLLAYTYLNKGEKSKARQIIEANVEGKTFEPKVLMYVAKIYKATGAIDKAKKLKNELSQAIYELGPHAEKSIANL